jgi:hypothetical protein
MKNHEGNLLSGFQRQVYGDGMCQIMSDDVCLSKGSAYGEAMSDDFI